jgi:hypothetical protein
MKSFQFIGAERGSILYGIVLILIIIVLATIFSLVDRKEQETRDFGYSRDPDRFDETKDASMFNDDDFISTSQSKQMYQPLFQSEDQIEEDLEKEDEKTPTNSFYRPPTGAEKRKQQSSQSTPRIRP